MPTLRGSESSTVPVPQQGTAFLHQHPTPLSMGKLRHRSQPLPGHTEQRATNAKTKI